MGQLKVIAIAAMDEGRVIGYRGDIPWKLPGEQKRFAELTRGHSVVMGRKTFDSLPARYKPLPDRKNIVLSRNLQAVEQYPEVECHSDALACIAACRSGDIELQSDLLWVIGGEQVYRDTLSEWDEVYLTQVVGKHPGDTYFPAFESEFTEVQREEFPSHSYLQYVRKAS